MHSPLVTKVYRRNTEELLSLIDSVEQNQVLALELVQNVREPVVRQEFALTFDQRFLNMSASIGAVIDYLRTLMENYTSSTVEREYADRNNQVKSSPLGAFMKDYRNCLLHAGFPPVRTSYNFQGPQSANPGEWSSEVYLFAKALLAWKKWSSPGTLFKTPSD